VSCRKNIMFHSPICFIFGSLLQGLAGNLNLRSTTSTNSCFDDVVLADIMNREWFTHFLACWQLNRSPLAERTLWAQGATITLKDDGQLQILNPSIRFQSPESVSEPQAWYQRASKRTWKLRCIVLANRWSHPWDTVSKQNQRYLADMSTVTLHHPIRTSDLEAQNGPGDSSHHYELTFPARSR